MHLRQHEVLFSLVFNIVCLLMSFVVQCGREHIFLADR